MPAFGPSPETQRPIAPGWPVASSTATRQPLPRVIWQTSQRRPDSIRIGEATPHVSGKPASAAAAIAILAARSELSCPWDTAPYRVEREIRRLRNAAIRTRPRSIVILT